MSNWWSAFVCTEQCWLWCTLEDDISKLLLTWGSKMFYTNSFVIETRSVVICVILIMFVSVNLIIYKLI